MKKVYTNFLSANINIDFFLNFMWLKESLAIHNKQIYCLISITKTRLFPKVS